VQVPNIAQLGVFLLSDASSGRTIAWTAQITAAPRAPFERGDVMVDDGVDLREYHIADK